MRETPTPPEYLHTITNAARQLGVSPWTVRDWIRQGKLPAYKVGRSANAPVRIKASDIDAMLIPIKPNKPLGGTAQHVNDTPAQSRQREAVVAVKLTELDGGDALIDTTNGPLAESGAE